MKFMSRAAAIRFICAGVLLALCLPLVPILNLYLVTEGPEWITYEIPGTHARSTAALDLSCIMLAMLLGVGAVASVMLGGWRLSDLAEEEKKARSREDSD